MSIGLGHQYFVHMILHFVGSLDECIEFMKANKPRDNKSWYELRPLVVIKKGKDITCDNYACDLVEDARLCK